MSEGHLQILNWNIAGAKYLDLPAGDGANTRGEFRDKLNKGLAHQIAATQPHVVTLQELVKYSDSGDEEHAECVIDVPSGYIFYRRWLISTNLQSAERKWVNVRTRGGWSPAAYFAQGNGFLVRDTLKIARLHERPLSGYAPPKVESAAERVDLGPGLYFGTRDTEPRSADIIHLILTSLDPMDSRAGEPNRLRKPLDVFIMNAHLTTLSGEREGKPETDELATEKRLPQLEIILKQAVSKYNTVYPVLFDDETRHQPIWVVAGDFNFTPSSVEYHRMISPGGFVDLVPDKKLGTKTSRLGRRPTLTLDYVFAATEFVSLDHEYLYAHINNNRVIYDEFVKVSDHFPLAATLPIRLP